MKSTNLTKGFQSMNATNVVSNDSRHGISQSEKTIEIAKSLHAIQSEMIAVGKDTENGQFKGRKYASLRAIWDALQPLLKKNNLLVMQAPGSIFTIEGKSFTNFTTRITHSTSGEWIQSIGMFPLERVNPQGYGSAVTYARRYYLSALMGIVVDDDDDGNAATGKGDDKKPAHKARPQDKPETNTDKVKTALRMAGCKGQSEANRVLNFIVPGQTLKTIEDDKAAFAVLKAINEGIEAKTLNLANVLEESKPEKEADQASAASPV